MWVLIIVFWISTTGVTSQQLNYPGDVECARAAAAITAEAADRHWPSPSVAAYCVKR